MIQLLSLVVLASADSTNVSPIGKVLALLGELEAKIIKDGEAQQKLYEEFADYCKDTSKEAQFEIETGTKDSERFQATMDESAAEVTEMTTKIEELSTSVATDTADLATATKLREKEAKDFAAADAEMAETVNMLGRAIAIIEKSMRGGPSLLQASAETNVAAALQTIIDASAANSLDKAKVQALVQSDDAITLDAKEAPSSGGILSTLEDMLEKAEAQQSEGQKNEMNGKHNFAMLEQSLKDSIATGDKELADAKKAKAAATEKNAAADGDNTRTQKEIAASQKTLKDLQHECMTRAEDFETEQHERNQELEALAAATKILQEKTGGASERAYGDSFVQVSMKTHSEGDSTTRVVALLRSVAKQAGATELAQLAMRVRSAVAAGADPFAKVRDMINEMVEKLVAEAQEEASKKAFCDKEMSETKAKMEDKKGEVEDLDTKIDQASAKIAKLQESIATLQSELAKLADEQKLANEMRQGEKETWEASKKDFEQGLEGVQMALQVLRDYYAQKDDASLIQTSDLSAQMASTASTSTSSSSGIIGMLEVAESDFSKMLAEGNAAEDQAQKEYETVTEDTRVTVATKKTEVKYKQKAQKEAEAFVADTKEDLGTSQTELDAIMEYWAKLQPQCVAKPEPYEERKKRREREIAGLKEALEILSAEAGQSFLAVRRA